MLFWASFVGLPSNGHYWILRLLTFFSSIFAAFMVYEENLHRILLFAYLIICILFNPIIPIRLSRHIWIYIDFLSGLLLLFALYYLLKDSDKSFKSIKTIIITLLMILFSLICIMNGDIISLLFSSAGSLLASLIFSFLLFAMGHLLLAPADVDPNRPTPKPLLFILIVAIAMLAYTSWKIFFKTIGIL